MVEVDCHSYLPTRDGRCDSEVREGLMRYTQLLLIPQEQVEVIKYRVGEFSTEKYFRVQET
jgi:hypothetical protein